MTPASASNAESQRTAICVVDGDPRERAALAQLLGHLQLEVQDFGSAEEMLAALDQLRVAVLISSLELPGQSGLELLHALRGRGLQVPTILLAGQSDVATAVGAIRAGAVDFIQKPVIDRILLRRVRDALEHAEL